MRYAVINTSTGGCENVVVWDGQSPWGPPEGTVAQQSDTLSIGDECEFINGLWQKKEE